MFDPIGHIRFLLLLLLLVPSVALAVNFNGNWAYRQAGGDNTETRSDFRQNYSMGVGPALSYQPSHALVGTASVGYTRRESDTGTEFVTSETITPTATISLKNDIFLTRLAGDTSSTRKEGGTGSSRTSWDASLLSQWAVPYFPTFRLSYNEEGENSRDSSFLADPEAESRNLNAAVSWDVYLGDLSYSHSQTQNEDLRSAVVIDSQSHLVRFETGGQLWDKRFGFNLVQQVQTSSQKVSSSGPGEDGDVDALVDVAVGRTVASAVTGPADPVPSRDCDINEVVGVDCLEDNPVLRNDDFSESSGFLAIDPGRRVHLGVDPGEPIEVVTLSFVSLFAGGVDSLQWDLYQFNFAVADWELVATGLPSLLLPQDQFQLDEGIAQIQVQVGTDQEFMLVANNTTGNELRLVEVEAFDRRASGSESTTFRYLSNFNARYRITRTLTSSVSLTLDHTEADLPGISLYNDKLTTSGNLRWAPVSYFGTSFGVSEYREMPEGREDLLDRNYSLVFSTIPLPEMNVSFGVQLNERFIDSRQTLEVIRYSISSKAQIYPDLSAALFFSYADGERLVSDDQSVESVSRENTFSSRLDLNARLFEKLTGDISISYSQSEDESDTRRSGTMDVGMRSRLSELLAVRGSYGINYIGQGRDTLNLSMDLRALDTRKTRLTLTATHNQADTVAQIFTLTGNWLINKNLSLVSQGSYRLAEEGDSYNFRASLNLSI